MASALIMPFHIDWPQGSDQANNTVNYRFWLPYAWRLEYIEVYATTPCTVGTHTLTVTEGSGGLTVLSGANYDMTALVAATATGLTLATGAVLELTAREVVTFAMASNNAGFDGSGIYMCVGARAH